MDIALKTLILIIFILIPGFLFRRTYYQGGFSKQFDSKSWSHSIFYSVLFALLLNFLVTFIFHNYYNYIDFLSCRKFYDEINKDKFPEIKYPIFILIVKYLGALYAASYILAFACYEIVRNFKLDRRFEALRFNNHWHYYFKGEIKDFREFSLPKGKCSCVNADILVKRDKDTDCLLYTSVMEKYIPGDYEFDVPAKLIDLYNKKDYGQYGKNGKMPVCFIGTNHTTGGNSGSPAIDAKGNLIGLNFDRVWEGTMSDIYYDPAICRNIMVDMRYVLFIIDKFAGAKHLINEMKVVGGKK